MIFKRYFSFWQNCHIGNSLIYCISELWFLKYTEFSISNALIIFSHYASMKLMLYLPVLRTFFLLHFCWCLSHEFPINQVKCCFFFYIFIHSVTHYLVNTTTYLRYGCHRFSRCYHNILTSRCHRYQRCRQLIWRCRQYLNDVVDIAMSSMSTM